MSFPEPVRVLRTIRGMPTSDGAGVRLTRVIGGPTLPTSIRSCCSMNSAPTAPRTTSPVSRSIRTAVSRPSPTCSTDACGIATTMATKAC